MPAEHTKDLDLFYCYARRDKALRDELDIHLAHLKRQYHIQSWHDQEISPGQAWQQAIDQHLNAAHLILLLISPDFMASDYCYRKEMARALERHAAGTCRVIPILIRPTDWEDAPFSTIQMLPTDAKPVTIWPNHDAAWWDVTQGIRRSVRELLPLLKTKDEWLEEGDTFRDLRQFEQALVAYDHAIRLDPTFARTYNRKGFTLNELQRFKEGLAACEQAIHLAPNYAAAYNNKGWALNELQRFEEALAAYDQAIHLDPNDASAYHNKGLTLNGLGRFEEALAACNHALHLDPNYAVAYYNKGNALYILRRYKEALVAYDHAIRLDPNNAITYNNKGNTLAQLKRSREAQECYQKARQLGYERREEGWTIS